MKEINEEPAQPLNPKQEVARDAIMGWLEDLMNKSEWFRKVQGDLYKEYTKADFAFISEFLACQLTIENLIEKDLARGGITKEEINGKKNFAEKIESLRDESYLLYPYKHIFHEMRVLRNNLVHELNYGVSDGDLKLLMNWYLDVRQTKIKERIEVIKSFTNFCLMTIELGENPMNWFTKSMSFSFKRRLVMMRKNLSEMDE